MTSNKPFRRIAARRGSRRSATLGIEITRKQKIKNEAIGTVGAALVAARHASDRRMMA